MVESYDVLIIGARVAGATLAARLGDAGHRVLLVDRAAFPSATLSTHYFRGADGVAVLADLAILDEVLTLGCPPLVRSYNYLNGEATPSIDELQNPGESGHHLSVRREVLDSLLIRRAIASGLVDFVERTAFVNLIRNDGEVVGARLRDAGNERDIHARLVVGADGRHSAVARALQPTVEEESPPSRAIYYCYVEGFAGQKGGEPDGAEFSWLGDEVAYVFPSDAGVTCVALSVNLEDYAGMRRTAEAAFRSRISAHRGLAERFERSRWVDRLWGCGPETSWVRVPHGDGWALVGDAGLHQDPWSGQGIDMATRHASFLAEEVDQWLGDRCSRQDALARYHERRNAHALPTYRYTTKFARDLRGLMTADA